MTTTDKLLPCPFCGGEAYLSDAEAGTGGLSNRARNPRCWQCGVDLGYCETAAEAIAAWNRRASQATPAPSEPVTLTYTNWQGKTAQRTITPVRVWFGSTPWHPEPQWLLTAVDAEKGLERDFALKDFGAPAPSDALRVPRALNPAQLADACMSYRHDYGLMIGDEKEAVRREAAEWWRCFEKTLNDPPAHLRAALSTPTEERQ